MDKTLLQDFFIFNNFTPYYNFIINTSFSNQNIKENAMLI